jgi:hypothetical protein
VVYFFMPNLTLQEAAALGTKVNGPFPNTVVGDEGVVDETTIGNDLLQTLTARIVGS